ncbi:hypothetical protein ACSLBF_21100 (plasmid) [Pseudoalteromonas sp. T1lg65]|uniref:hypothetical protein n=1 Tax=Pseudoalteromonas sp. T1lg65 TaxID=2077101 RepID=UPI003F7A8046
MRKPLLGSIIAFAGAFALSTSTAVSAGTGYTQCNYLLIQGTPAHLRPPGSENISITHPGNVLCDFSYVGEWGYYSLTSQKYVPKFSL